MMRILLRNSRLLQQRKSIDPFPWPESLMTERRRCKISNYSILKPIPYSIGTKSGQPAISNVSVSYNLSSNTLSSPTNVMKICQDEIAVENGDDCFAISKSNNVSTFSLLYENGLAGYCSNFPKQGKLCLPKTCEIYQVKKGDSCFSIAHANNYKFSKTQLMSWNPNINRGCSNLEQLEKTYICIR